MRLTVAQALVRFLSVQEVERDGRRERFFAGCFGIFGHGNVAGLGQALKGGELPFHQARNEQAMVHIAAGYARQKNRLGAYACTSIVGPGATNMVTGAALATINRLPVLLLPGDTFANRAPHPVLQQLEAPHDATLSVNDCFKPVSRYFDRDRAPGAAHPGGARGDARADRPGRDRRGHAGAARGRPDGGLRGPGRLPRAARVDGVPPAGGGRGDRPRGRAGAQRGAAADRGRRRRDLRGGDGRAARVRRGDRDPGGRDPGGPRRAPVRAPAVAGRGRRDRHERRQPPRAGGRPRARRRHPLERLHDRLEVRLPGLRRAVRQRQRHRARRRQAHRPPRPGRRARGARAAARAAGRPSRRPSRGRGGPARRRRSSPARSSASSRRARASPTRPR